MLLEFTISDNDFRCNNPYEVSTVVDIDYIKCNFILQSEAWKGLEAVVAVFKSPSYNITEEVLLDNSNSCYIPSEVYKHGGVIQVSVYGDKYGLMTDGKDRRTTIKTQVLEFYVNENVVVPLPTPNKFDIFVAEYVNAKQAMIDYQNYLQRLLDEGAFDGRGIESASFDENGVLTLVFDDGFQLASPSLIGPQGEQGDPGSVFGAHAL